VVGGEVTHDFAGGIRVSLSQNFDDLGVGHVGVEEHFFCHIGRRKHSILTGVNAQFFASLLLGICNYFQSGRIFDVQQHILATSVDGTQTVLHCFFLLAFDG
jgi:hypothetical protein